MAKEKKQELKLEDRLSQALVTEDEQPYEIPCNWAWTRLKHILDVRDGTHDTPKYIEHGIPLITSKNLVDDNLDFDNVKFISEEDHIKISERSGVSDGDILMAMIGTIGNPVVVKKSQEFSIKNVALFKVLPSTGIKPKYIYNFLKSSEEHMREHASGGLQPFVSLSYLRDYPVPLIPLAEQQRINDRVESLFEKLDNAKELAQKALDTFESHKASILHRAFTGEFTAKWREKNGVGMDSWEQKPLTEICTLKSGTTIPVEQELPAGSIPYVKVADMNLPDNTFDITMSSRYVDDYKENHLIPIGSIIFPKRGGAIFTNKKRMVLTTPILADLNIMAIIPDEKHLKSLYCYYWYLSIDLKELNNGSNVPQINNKDMIKLIIPKPSIQEQQEIIYILDNLFEKEEKARELCDIINKIDLMKKVILARAYRGQLGTNDPSEEGALGLLKVCMR